MNIQLKVVLYLLQQVLQLNIYSCLNKWNNAHNLNTSDVSLRVNVHHTRPFSLHGYAQCRQLSKSVI